MSDPIELLLMLALGVGLSAAAGFRVFVPMLVASMGARTGHIELAAGFDWLASTPALVMLSCATVLEVGAYFLPFVDNALDMVAAPFAVIAGVLLTAGVIADVSPLLQWGLAIVAGGGSAGVVQAGTTAVRAASSTFTAGLGNGALAALELLSAIAVAVLALLLPVLALLLLVLVGVLTLRWGARRWHGAAAG